MKNQESLDPLGGYITLREITPLVGSYFTAYSLAAAGRFGPPVVVGRTQFFRRHVAEGVIAERIAAKKGPR